MKSKYVIEFGVSRAGMEKAGYDYDREADSLKEAKKIAKYVMSEEFRVSGEMSECFGYARVMNAKKECVDEFFGERELAAIRAADMFAAKFEALKAKAAKVGLDAVILLENVEEIAEDAARDGDIEAGSIAFYELAFASIPAELERMCCPAAVREFFAEFIG